MNVIKTVETILLCSLIGCTPVNFAQDETVTVNDVQIVKEKNSYELEKFLTPNYNNELGYTVTIRIKKPNQEDNIVSIDYTKFNDAPITSLIFRDSNKQFADVVYKQNKSIDYSASDKFNRNILKLVFKNLEIKNSKLGDEDFKEYSLEVTNKMLEFYQLYFESAIKGLTKTPKGLEVILQNVVNDTIEFIRIVDIPDKNIRRFIYKAKGYLYYIEIENLYIE